MLKLKPVLSLLAALSISTSAIAGEQADELAAAGAEAYKRCAACHLADGAGVPGAFPPLNDRFAELAVDEAGRAYLVLVVQSGLSGNLNINGAMYAGFMPPQGALFNKQDFAAVLNHLVLGLGEGKTSEGWKPFTAEEIEKTLAENPGASAMSNATLRAELKKKFPQL
jgi:cytochrome c553